MKFLGLIPQRFLGIDIGTSFIKVVELSSWARRKKLENYGEISASVLYKKPFRTFDKNTLLLSSGDISKAIRAVIEEAGIETRQVVFSIPDFSSFFTTVELPPMTSEEIPQAVRAEARRHVPLPLGEVTLDWQLINPPLRPKEKKPKILLVTVPNEVINQYQRIADDLKLELLGLEAEVFGLIRSLIEKEEERFVGLIDIGARSTTCSIARKGILNVSRSFDLSGNNLIERISKGLSVDYETAERIRNEQGIVPSPDNQEKNEVREILIPLIDLIIREVRKIFHNFYEEEQKGVKKIILAGGTALLPGLLEYFQKSFTEEEVEIANPFYQLYFPPILEEVLREMSPSYAVAVGMALRGLE